MQNNTRAVVRIVDDDRAMRRSLQMVVEAAGLKSLVYDSAEAFLEAYDADVPGCLVLDMSMPGMSGFELYTHMLERTEPLPIIFLTGHGDVTAAVHAMKMGAVDFLEKPVDHHVLVERICTAIDIDIEQRLDRAEKQPVLDAMHTLTRREQEVLDLILDGLGNKQIAAELHRSIRTVENHRSRILAKFDVRSSTLLVRKVLHVARA